MSIAAMSCALSLRGVTSSEKLLLLALANYADENMRCWPSQKRLVEDTCLSLRSVRNLLAALEARDMISKTERQRQDGSRSTDIITLHFAGKVEAQVAGGGAVVAGGVGQWLPDPPAVVAGLTTFEPPSNHQDEPILVAQSAPTKTRRVRLVPDNWEPSERLMADLVIQGFVSGEIERELASFRDHEFRDPKSDFDRAFRTWMRNSRKFNPRKANDRPHHNAKFDATQANLARAFAGADHASGPRWEP